MFTALAQIVTAVALLSFVSISNCMADSEDDAAWHAPAAAAGPAAGPPPPAAAPAPPMEAQASGPAVFYGGRLLSIVFGS